MLTPSIRMSISLGRTERVVKVGREAGTGGNGAGVNCVFADCAIGVGCAICAPCSCSGACVGIVGMMESDMMISPSSEKFSTLTMMIVRVRVRIAMGPAHSTGTHRIVHYTYLLS